ncbi:unnamed protein product, partial [Brachionus calyciflorus]
MTSSSEIIEKNFCMEDNIRLKPKRSEFASNISLANKSELSDNDSDDENKPLIRKKRTSKNLIENENLDLNYRNSPTIQKINTPVFDDFDIYSSSGEYTKKPSFLDRLLNIFFTKKNHQNNKNNFNSTFSSFFHKYSSHLSTAKTIILVIYSIVCIILFSLNGPVELKWTQTVISSSQINQFSCSTHSHGNSAKFLRLKLNGPFIEEEDLNKNEVNSGKYVRINLLKKTSLALVSNWSLILEIPEKNDEYKENKIVSKNFNLKKSYKLDELIFQVNTNVNKHLSFNYNCQKLSDQFEYRIVCSTCLLIFVYILIIFELTHRTLAAGLGAIGGITLISIIETEKPSLELIVTWVEWETILLLFGMMIIVAVFCETGLFDLIAVRLFHYAGTRVWTMIGLLCLLSAVLSAFLDNVTTILLLTPITIRLCEIMKLDPRRIIIAEVLFSNIGGAATAIGDPPNVIITANQIINMRGVDFSSFTFHMFTGCIFVYAICFLHFKFLYADPKNFFKEEENELDEMSKEIAIWKRSFMSITPVTKEEKIVKTLLKEKAFQLESLLKQKEVIVKKEYEKNLIAKSHEMLESYKITNKPLLIKCSIIFLVTLILFFLNPFIDEIHLTIGWISILSALLVLASSSGHAHSNNGQSVSSTIDFEGLMHKVEWSTLLFFGCLFIFMKSIEELGLLNYLGNLISDMIKSVENISDRLAFALLMLIVLSALISSVIDNIPFTTAMIPIIIQLSDQADLPLQPLVYALAFGSCLGGNGSLVGASCNLVAAGISEQHGYKITFKDFFKTGFPIMNLCFVIEKKMSIYMRDNSDKYVKIPLDAGYVKSSINKFAQLDWYMSYESEMVDKRNIRFYTGSIEKHSKCEFNNNGRVGVNKQ